MKRTLTYFALVLTTVLATGGLVGCGQNAPSQPSASEASPQATEPTGDEVIAELQSAVANAPLPSSIRSR